MVKKLLNCIKFLLLIVIIINTTAGCFESKKQVSINKKGNSSTKSTINNENNSSYKPTGKYKNEKTTTLTLYFSDLTTGYKEVVSAINDRLLPDLNLKVDFKKFDITADYYDIGKVEALLKSGKPCDAISIWDPILIGGYSNISIFTLAAKGLLKDITSLFPENAHNIFSRLSEDELKQLSYNGKIIAVPNYAPRSMRKCIFVRKKLLTKYKISSIESLEDFDKFLNTITGKETEYNINISWTPEDFIDYYGYVDIGGYFVYKRDDPDMKLIPWEQTPEFLEASNFIQRWCNFNNENISGSKKSKNAADILDYGAIPYSLPSSETEWNSKTWTDVWEAFPLNINTPATKYPINMCTFVINENSDNADKVLSFLEWVQTDINNYKLVMDGIKKRDENKQILNSKDDYVGDYAFYNKKCADEIYTQDVSEDVDNYIMSVINDIQLNLIYPYHIGFTPSEDIGEIKQARYLDFSMKNSEYFLPAHSFNVNGFIKSQKDKGINAAVERIQEQLNDWKNKN